MRLLLDTTVLIDFLRGRRNRPAFLAQCIANKMELATSAVSVAEVYAGLQSAHEQRAAAFLDEIEVIDVTAGVARRGGKYRFEWARKGETISLPDALIAATAVEHRMHLATDNPRDFPMPEIELYPLPSA